jgi:hypothetical protein
VAVVETEGWYGHDVNLSRAHGACIGLSHKIKRSATWHSRPSPPSLRRLPLSHAQGDLLDPRDPHPPHHSATAQRRRVGALRYGWCIGGQGITPYLFDAARARRGTRERGPGSAGL